MQSRHNNVMEQPGGSVWVLDSLDAGAIFSGRLVYNKGAAIIHTMRFLINDDAVFFDILQTYQQTFADSTAHAADLKALLNLFPALTSQTILTNGIMGKVIQLIVLNGIRSTARSTFKLIKARPCQA